MQFGPNSFLITYTDKQGKNHPSNYLKRVEKIKIELPANNFTQYEVLTPVKIIMTKNLYFNPDNNYLVFFNIL